MNLSERVEKAVRELLFIRFALCLVDHPIHFRFGLFFILPFSFLYLHVGIPPVGSADVLQSARTLQQPIQLPLLTLQIAVPANVLFRDEDVRHAALARDLLQRILQSSAVLNLIQLHQVVLVLAAELFVQQRLGGTAVGAVGFAEDDDGVAVDDLLRFRFGGRHGGRTGGSKGCDEAAEEGSYDCGVEVLMGCGCCFVAGSSEGLTGLYASE